MIGRLIKAELDEIVKSDKTNPRNKLVVTDQNREILTNLKLYLARSSDSKWELNKGLLFSGTVGNGKTMLLQCVRVVMAKVWKKVLTEYNAPFIRENYYKDAEHDRVSISTQLHTYRFVAINDMGMEKNYKGGTNIIMNILFDRFEQRFITHGSTNLTKEEFAARYDDDKGRMFDRFHQMFTFIEIKGNSFRSKS